jgi:Ca2+-binding RTX toxin-like protein
MRVDLTGKTKIKKKKFENDLSAYDGVSGQWSTGVRRDVLQTNSNKSVFLDGTQVTNDGKMVGVNPLSVKDGVLNIGSGVLDNDSRSAVQDILHQTGQGSGADTVDYYTGVVSTDETWGQTYGYFEAEIQVPEGKGHWSAFWLKPAGEGWPPEITFEMYGRGLEGKSTPKDNTVSTSVIFDKRNHENPDQINDVEISNFYVRVDENGNILYNADGSFDTVNGTPQEVMRKSDGTYRFVSDNITTGGGSFELDNNSVKQHLGLTTNGDGDSIYDSYWTYGIQWTPDTITFWLGQDKDNMEIVFQTPTTDDHHVAMSLVMNDQIGTSGGWWDPILDENGNPQEGMFAEDNGLKIKSVSVYMMDPENTLRGQGDGAILYDGDEKTQIIGTDGDDWIVTGQGEDVIELKGGADTVWADRGKDNKIISGFGDDDVMVLEGYNIADAHDALARLTQVGEDVWLSNGAYPANPQTIVFRDAQVSDFSASNFVVRWSETPDIWAGRLRDGTLQTEISEDGFQHARKGWADLNGDGTIQNDPTAEGYEQVGIGTRFFLAAGSNGIVGSSEGDAYYGVRSDTVIIEEKHGGIDTVYSANTFTLSDNVENLVSRFTGTSATDKTRYFTGNKLDNRMTGNVASEVFEGGVGEDLIDLTLGGADRVVFGQGDGHDVVLGFRSNDVLEIDDFVFSSWSDLKSHMSNWGEDLRVDLGAGHSVVLRDMQIEDVRRGQFDFEKGDDEALGTGLDPWLRPSDGAERIDVSMTSEQWLMMRQSEMTRLELKEFFDDVVKLPTGSGQHSDHDGVLVVGNRGSDNLRGNGSSDAYLLNGGRDTVHAGGDDDFVFGGSGNDSLIGDRGADVLRGGLGADKIEGNRGDDLLWGEHGRDKLKGGNGADLFLLRTEDRRQDIIKDFDASEGDRIAIDDRSGDLEILLQQRGNSVQILARQDDDLVKLAQVRASEVEDVQEAIIMGWDMG